MKDQGARRERVDGQSAWRGIEGQDVKRRGDGHGVRRGVEGQDARRVGRSPGCWERSRRPGWEAKSTEKVRL